MLLWSDVPWLIAFLGHHKDVSVVAGNLAFLMFWERISSTGLPLLERMRLVESTPVSSLDGHVFGPRPDGLEYCTMT